MHDRKNRRQPSTGTLGPSAWNFKGVTEDEVERCYLHEYAKESVAIVDAVLDSLKNREYAQSDDAKKRRTDWFALNPRPLDERERVAWGKKSLAEIGDVLARTKLRPDLHFLIDLADEKFFPTSHWLEIDSTVRRRYALPPERERMGSLDLDPATLETRPLHIENLDAFLESWARFDLHGVQVDGMSGPHFFNLWWARSDRKLTADFAKWLRENRPKDEPAFQTSRHGGSRRTTPRDLLKALGAFRLMKTFQGDWVKAREHTEQLIGKPLYSDQPAWKKAANRAEEHTVQFQKKMLQS